ncbi:MAG TPA: CHAT domain-containing protein [Gemmatimonadaceae bacterium]|jgi:tetratricopeptide (TPR) repeat protein|nr:CHAT domain-containing protein [Gemmatimonadaceae bacterium]
MPASKEKVTPPPAPLHITVVNGDLTFIRQPLLLGHYRSTRLSGAEGVMNNVLGGGMQRSLDAGLYPTQPGTHQVFVNTVGDPDNPWRLPRPEAVIVVGLGPEGELRAVDLVGTVRQGVLAWAQRRMEEPKVGSALELSATLIGSGGSGISAGQAAQLIAHGVREANEHLASAGWPPVGRLQLVELYEDRAIEAWRELRLQQAACPTEFAVDDAIDPSVGGLPRALDPNYRGASYGFISAQARQDPGLGTSIDYSIDTKRARTEVRGKTMQSDLMRELIAGAATDESTDTRIGRTLFRLLIPLEVTPFLIGTSEMLLEVDSGTAGIPWELLDVPSEGGDDLPWAIRSKLLRKLRTRQLRERPVDADVEASILVVGEPAADEKSYPRLPGARLEATAVAACLAGALGAESVRSLISPPDPTKKGADARTIVNALMERPWRVVHVAGHGEPPSKEVTGGVVLSKGFLGPSEIESMPVVPELVFVNCCYLAQRASESLLAEARPTHDLASFAAAVADKLIEIGVRCVVAAGWAVDDAAASAFATTFYDALVRGRRFMDAVEEARIAAHALGGNTWAAYQCYGDPDWTLNRSAGTQRVARSMEDEFEAIASSSSLRLALDTIEVGSTYQKKDNATQIARIEYLESRFGKRWEHEGDTADAFGRAWRAVGERAKAIEWFERAVAASDATASLGALEQIGNQRALLAWSMVERARGEGDDSKLREAVKDARADIASALELLGRMNDLQPTMRRAALLGSTYKRLALIETLAGRKDAAHDAVVSTVEHYAAAEKLGNEIGDDDVSYPGLNHLAAELVLNIGNEKWKGFAPGAAEKVRRRIEAKALSDPDFWTVVDQSGIVLLETLAAGTLAENGAKIETELQVLAGRVSTAWMWSSVRDHVEFLLLPYAAHASGPEKKAARSLLALVERLAGKR